MFSIYYSVFSFYFMPGLHVILGRGRGDSLKLHLSHKTPLSGHVLTGNLALDLGSLGDSEIQTTLRYDEHAPLAASLLAEERAGVCV